MAWRSLGIPRLAEYRWLRELWAASASFSTAISGEGMSGLPKPRSMTSSPARPPAALSPSMIGKTYGGSALIRRNSMPVRLSVGLPASRTTLLEHVDHRGAGVGEDAA